MTGSATSRSGSHCTSSARHGSAGTSTSTSRSSARRSVSRSGVTTVGRLQLQRRHGDCVRRAGSAGNGLHRGLRRRSRRALDASPGFATASSDAFSERVRPGVSPHAPYSVSIDVYEACAGLGLPIATHISESRSEVAYLLTGEGAWGAYKDLLVDAPGATGTRLLAEHDLLGPNLVAAHCVVLEDDEIGLLAATGTGVAHCPGRTLRSAAASRRWPSSARPVRTSAWVPTARLRRPRSTSSRSSDLSFSPRGRGRPGRTSSRLPRRSSSGRSALRGPWGSIRRPVRSSRGSGPTSLWFPSRAPRIYPGRTPPGQWCSAGRPIACLRRTSTGKSATRREG